MDDVTKVVLAIILTIAFGIGIIAYDGWSNRGCVAAVAAHGWTPQQAKEACR